VRIQHSEGGHKPPDCAKIRPPLYLACFDLVAVEEAGERDVRAGVRPLLLFYLGGQFSDSPAKLNLVKFPRGPRARLDAQAFASMPESNTGRISAVTNLIYGTNVYNTKARR
jgi:hypothetical protein